MLMESVPLAGDGVTFADIGEGLWRIIQATDRSSARREKVSQQMGSITNPRLYLKAKIVLFKFRNKLDGVCVTSPHRSSDMRVLLYNIVVVCQGL